MCKKLFRVYFKAIMHGDFFVSLFSIKMFSFTIKYYYIKYKLFAFFQIAFFKNKYVHFIKHLYLKYFRKMFKIILRLTLVYFFLAKSER